MVCHIVEVAFYVAELLSGDGSSFPLGRSGMFVPHRLTRSSTAVFVGSPALQLSLAAWAGIPTASLH
eukprot:5624841-Prorocentrum_lima.AAC.1